MTKEEHHEYYQTYIMYLKYRYYENHTSIVPDNVFDSLEILCKGLKKELGIEENAIYPTDMVGINYNSSY